MAIFTHVTLGTNDLEKARKFYDAVFAPLGLKRLHDMDNLSLYGADHPEFIVLKPANGEPACIGNGLTIGFHTLGDDADAQLTRDADQAFDDDGACAT